MNGRIYDPLLGRFLSGDLVVQFPGDLQSFNRYSYVRNNPLTATDPTGFEEPADPEGDAIRAEEKYERTWGGNLERVATASGAAAKYGEAVLTSAPRVAGEVILWEAGVRVAGGIIVRGAEVLARVGGELKVVGRVVRAGEATGEAVAAERRVSQVVRSVAEEGSAVRRVEGAAADTRLAPEVPRVAPSTEAGAASRSAAKDFSGQLGVSDNSARRSLNNAVAGEGGQAHHVIPWQMRSHELVKRAAAGGFNMNGANNGIRLGANQHLGSHSLYNEAIMTKLNSLLKANPEMSNADAAKALQEYADQVRKALERSQAKLK